MPQDKLSFSDHLSQKEINTLARLPSVKERKIDIFRTVKTNQVVVLRNASYQILRLTFYHDFGNFIYPHTAIGRSQYEEMMFDHFLALMIDLAPIYAVQVTRSAFQLAQKYGASEVLLDEVDESIPDFVESIANLTGHRFYREGNILMDKDDKRPIKNPILLFTKSSYREALAAASFGDSTRCPLRFRLHP